MLTKVGFVPSATPAQAQHPNALDNMYTVYLYDVYIYIYVFFVVWGPTRVIYVCVYVSVYIYEPPLQKPTRNPEERSALLVGMLNYFTTVSRVGRMGYDSCESSKQERYEVPSQSHLSCGYMLYCG